MNTKIAGINNIDLLKSDAFINGKWVTSKAEKRFDVFNPFDGTVLSEVADCDEVDTNIAIAAAESAFGAWKGLPAHKRAKILGKWKSLIVKNVDDLAKILTAEQGKTLVEAKGEILYGASFVDWFAQEAVRVYGDIITPYHSSVRMFASKQAIGVVGAITPWNFPNAMITRKVAPALAAGCTVVIKPAEATPLSALALAHLAKVAGMPDGVLNIVPSNQAPKVGKALTESRIVRKISFTGSTQVGKLLYRQCANTVKKISLELGGNAPFIVFDDANIDLAVKGALASKYRNSGQTCICANRIYVQSGIYEDFVEALSRASEQLACGCGTQSETQIGPLINQEAVDKVQSLVDNAKAQGAVVRTGGMVEQDLIYQPTVLSNVDPNMDIFHQEIFGPVAAVYSFDTDEEVVKLANDTNFGLAAYFFTNNQSRVWILSEQLEYGMIGINTTNISSANAPFGGVKESGIGREGSKYGIEEYLEIKYLCLGGLK